MKRIFFLISFLLGLVFMSGGSVQAQTSCFDGSSWTGPSGNPPSSNRVKPLYSTCGSTQVVTGDNFIVQFGENDASVYPNNASGFNIRVQDTINNAEIQLQYSAGADDHWSMYNNQSDDSFRIWGGGDNRLTILQNGNVGVGITTPSNKLDVNGIIETSGPTNTGAEGGLFIRNQLVGSPLTGGLRIGGITTEQKYADIYWADGTNFYWAVNSGGVRNLHFRNNNAGIGLYFGNPTYSSTNQSVFYSDVDINGSIKIADGTETDGYVLVSDTNGLASWKPVSAANGSFSGYWDLTGNLLYPTSTNYNVGIGTASPGAKLDVEDSVSGSGYVAEFRNTFSFTNSVAKTVYIEGAQAIMTGGSATSYGLYIQGGLAQNDPATSHALYARAGVPSVGGIAFAGTFVDPIGTRILLLRDDTAATTGDWLGQINFDSTAGGISTVDAPVILRGSASESHGSGDKGGYFTVLTKPTNTNANASAIERFRIDQNGNVGIGTSSPDETLDVAGNVIFGGSNGSLRVATGATGLYLEGYNGARNGTVSKMYFAGYQGTDNTMTLDLPNGFVGIATTTPAYNLDVYGDIRSLNYYGDSDRRLKKNIKPLPSVLAGLQELQPVSFEWKSHDTGINIGLIAQDVEQVFPEVVATDQNGYKSIAYDQVSILLLAGMQEQQHKIDELESRIDRLEKILNKTK